MSSSSLHVCQLPYSQLSLTVFVLNWRDSGFDGETGTQPGKHVSLQGNLAFDLKKPFKCTQSGKHVSLQIPPNQQTLLIALPNTLHIKGTLQFQYL